MLEQGASFLLLNLLSSSLGYSHIRNPGVKVEHLITVLSHPQSVVLHMIKDIRAISRSSAAKIYGLNIVAEYIQEVLRHKVKSQDQLYSGSKFVEQPKIIGVHPVFGEKVFLKHGPFGTYMQLGEDRKGHTPKQTSVSQIKDVNSITLDEAIDLLRFPIPLGYHPKDGQCIPLKLAKTGYSISYKRVIAKVPKDMKPVDVTMEAAMELLVSDKVTLSGRRKSAKPHGKIVEAS